MHRNLVHSNSDKDYHTVEETLCVQQTPPQSTVHNQIVTRLLPGTATALECKCMTLAQSCSQTEGMPGRPPRRNLHKAPNLQYCTVPLHSLHWTDLLQQGDGTAVNNLNKTQPIIGLTPAWPPPNGRDSTRSQHRKQLPVAQGQSRRDDDDGR